MKIVSIKSIGVGKVRNLTVFKNHTFLTENGIPTHNCDFGNPKLLSDLHPVLEGRGFMVKRLNKMIFPKEGFMVIATANTRGRGEGSEYYVGTNVLNKAFLERFAAFIEFSNPTKSELIKIINNNINGVPEPVIKGVVEWYDKINDAIKNGVLIEHVGIRRVIDICKLAKKYKVSSTNDKNMVRALEKGCNIYPSDMSEALRALWDALYISGSNTQTSSSNTAV